MTYNQLLFDYNYTRTSLSWLDSYNCKKGLLYIDVKSVCHYFFFSVFFFMQNIYTSSRIPFMTGVSDISSSDDSFYHINKMFHISSWCLELNTMWQLVYLDTTINIWKICYLSIQPLCFWLFILIVPFEWLPLWIN